MVQQPIVRRIALRAVQLAIAAAGILVIMLVFSRQAHAATLDNRPTANSASSVLSGVGAGVQSAASPVTSAASQITLGGHAAPATSSGSTAGGGSGYQGSSGGAGHSSGGYTDTAYPGTGGANSGGGSSAGQPGSGTGASNSAAGQQAANAPSTPPAGSGTGAGSAGTGPDGTGSVLPTAASPLAPVTGAVGSVAKTVTNAAGSPDARAG